MVGEERGKKGICRTNVKLLPTRLHTGKIIVRNSTYWPAKQQLHRQQSVIKTSRHLTSTENRSRQSDAAFGSHHRDTNQWLPDDSISSCRHRSDPVQSENSCCGRLKVGELWGHPL